MTIWGVRSGTDVYIRSGYGPRNGWFRHAAGSGEGRIRAGGTERDVTFEPVDPGRPLHRDIDLAYHAKYDSYGPQIVGSVVGRDVHARWRCRGTLAGCPSQARPASGFTQERS